MIDALPWVVYWYYISVGYLLVVGVTGGVIAVGAYSYRNRVTYGTLALLGLAAAGLQLACVAYYLAASIDGALTALAWFADCASVALLSASVYLVSESRGQRLPKRYVAGAVLAAAAAIIFNRLSDFPLHVSSLSSPSLAFHPWYPQLRYVQGMAGAGAWLWLAGAYLALTFAAHWLWRGRSVLGLKRAIIRLVLLSLAAAAIAADALIYFGLTSGIYTLGFALTLMVLWISVQMAVDAAGRSRQLLMREREIEGEVRQRLMAEDELQRLSQVFMQAPAATHIVDLQGQALQVNEESVRYFKRDVSAAPRINFVAVLEQFGVSKDALIKHLSLGDVAGYGPYFFTAGQAVAGLSVERDAWLSFKMYPIFDHQRQLREFVARVEDVSERQFVESAINTISTAVSAETGRAFFNQLVVNLAQLLNKKYVYIGLKMLQGSRQFIETTAVAVDGALVENFSFELNDSPSLQVLREGSFAVPEGLMQRFPEHHFLHSLRAQSYIGAAITDVDKTPIGVIAVLDDRPIENIKQLQEIVNIFVSRAGTELHRLEAESRIRKMAYEDYLTSLPNRTRLNEYVAEALADTDARANAFVQVDLDHFKTINDALGHDIGDDVLCHIGARLRQYLPDDVLVGRIGGDEFAIVFRHIQGDAEQGLHAIAEKLMVLMEQPVKVGEHLLDVGCTMGIVLFPEFARTTIDVFRHADIALNKAKVSGRGGYHLFTPEMRDSVSKRLNIEKGLRAALQNREFMLYYQPQVDGEGKPVGAEALIRWQHPQQGWIPPIVFIPVAEETGLINPVGQWVLAQALSDRKRWSQAHVPFIGHLSVNVSPWQFARPDFVETTIGAIDAMQVPPNQITLEVTESALLTDLPDTIAKLRQLRGFGVTIALDDFGTGYSSLAYLRDLPLDILKIDKAFVDALETNAHEPLVESMISIGRHMGLQVIAEGVETQVQLERLRSMGCTTFQGYLFAKPLAEAKFRQWLFGARV